MKDYQKRRSCFIFKLLLGIEIIILMCFIFGCSTDNSKEPPLQISNSDTDSPKQPQKTENDRDTWVTVGMKIRELDAISGIEEPAILVNGYPITKKEVETQKIYSKYLKNVTVKEGIESLISAKAVKAEAVRLNVKPSKEKIDAYLEQSRASLDDKVIGTETIFAYIEGLGITQEEYISMLENTAYDMYQREALWEMVESSQKGRDYEQYISELVENAKVEILDSQVKTLLAQ